MNPTLVPALLRIQDRHGFLPEKELEFLAVHAGVPLYRLEELTTFFPHFRRQPPPKVAVHICDSMSCHLRGSADLLDRARELQQKLGPDNLEVRGVSCLGRCDLAPVAFLSRHTRAFEPIHDHLCTRLGEELHRPLLPLLDAVCAGRPIPETHADPHPAREQTPPDWQIDVYRQAGDGTSPAGMNPAARYAAVRQLLADEAGPKKPPQELLTAEVILARLKEACLFGMGGAAATTATKWNDVRQASRERKTGTFIVCNGDESEPGTFKDREILLHAPHLVIEGMLLAGLILQAEDGGSARGYLYIRHEYHEQIEACRREIEAARQLIPEALNRCPIEVFVSPGAYICGEESALIEAIEGKRAQPRNQPPSIRANGLDDKPTLVNNVETFAWVPAIVLKRSGWWQAQPRRFFSISGDVNSPGVFEVPFASTTLGDLITLAGGMRGGRKLQAVAPSGPSQGFLPATLPLSKAALLERLSDRAITDLAGRSPHAAAWVRAFRDGYQGEQLDVTRLLLDKQFFKLLRLDLGAGIVVYDETASLLDQAINCLKFFEKESCGKCVPCRLGCQQLVHLAEALRPQATTLTPGQVRQTVPVLAEAMEVTSICGLGRTAAKPLTTLLEHFSDELTP